MPWIIGGAALLSGVLGAEAAKDAAKTSNKATDLAIGENRRQFDIIREDTAPSRDVGQGALYKLADIFGVSSPEQRTAAKDTKAMDAEISSLLHNNNYAAGKIKELEKKISQYDSLKQWKGTGFGGSLKKSEYDIAVKDLAQLRANTAANESRIAELSKQTADPVRRIQPLTPNAGKSGGGVPSLYGNLEMDPGYDFRRAEGEKAIQRMQSAGGTRYGGAALKAAARYGQDYASNEFSNAVNRRNAELGYLFSLAGFGPQGIATAGQAGAATAGNNSNILMQNAQMQGNAALTGASAINNAVQGGIQNYYTQNLLRNYNRTPQIPTTQRASIYNDFAVA